MKWFRLGALWLGTPLLVACGSVIYSTLPPTEESRFDFRHPPPCESKPVEENEYLVHLRYLGAGGLYLEWRGEAILFSPFFSNPGMLRVPFGRWKPDTDRIEAGLVDLELDRVGGLVVGHAHYDHLGDVPTVAAKVPRAQIYANTNGKSILSPWLETVGEVKDLSEATNRWTRLEDRDGNPLPFKIYPIASSHAHHLGPFCWRCGNPGKVWPEDKKVALLNELWAGQDLSFILDLLDAEGNQTLFRFFYQDAASNQGVPEQPFHGESPIPVDLAMLCMASSSEVPGHPEELIGNLRPKHLLYTHYEDFFRSPNRPLRFVPLLTDRKADDFVRGAENALADLEHELTRPLNKVCGPTALGWSMPLPGKELIFEARVGVPK